MECVDEVTIRTLLSESLKLSPEERREYLTNNWDGDVSKLDEVVSSLEEQVFSLLGQGTSSLPSDSASGDKASSAGSAPNLVGRTIGPYIVERSIARGGMGHVYRAYRMDGEFHQTVAIKVVEHGKIEASLFKQERQTLADLDSPNIVSLLDGGTLEEGYPYLVMEYVEGLPIDAYVDEHHLDKRDIVQLVCEVSKCLQKAHNCGVIHCDIKPANIMVTHDGEIRLLDFGIARVMNKTQSTQLDFALCNALTPPYSSPQRCNNLKPSMTDDVYSLGILLAHLITGKRPLTRQEGESRTHQAHKIVQKYRQYIADKELRAIFLCATDADEDKRYPSAYTFRHDLGNWLEMRPVNAVGRKFSYLVRKHFQRHWKDWSVIVASLLLVTFFVQSHMRTKPEMQQFSLNISRGGNDNLKQPQLLYIDPENKHAKSIQKATVEAKGRNQEPATAPLQMITNPKETKGSIVRNTLTAGQSTIDEDKVAPLLAYIKKYFATVKSVDSPKSYYASYTQSMQKKLSLSDYQAWWDRTIDRVELQGYRVLDNKTLQVDLLYKTIGGIFVCKRDTIHFETANNHIKIDDLQSIGRKCPERLRQLFIHAIREDDLLTLQKLRNAMDSLDFLSSDFNSSPLLEATYHANLDIVKYLVSEGADVNAIVEDGTNRTALDIARERKNTDIEAYLLDHGGVSGMLIRSDTSEESN